MDLVIFVIGSSDDINQWKAERIRREVEECIQGGVGEEIQREMQWWMAWTIEHSDDQGR